MRHTLARLEPTVDPSSLVDLDAELPEAAARSTGEPRHPTAAPGTGEPGLAG